MLNDTCSCGFSLPKPKSNSAPWSSGPASVKSPMHECGSEFGTVGSPWHCGSSYQLKFLTGSASGFADTDDRDGGAVRLAEALEIHAEDAAVGVDVGVAGDARVCVGDAPALAQAAGRGRVCVRRHVAQPDVRRSRARGRVAAEHVQV